MRKICLKWGIKLCSKCQFVLLPNNFYKDKRYSDGRYPLCKACKINSRRKWQTNNRDRHNETRRTRHKRLRETNDPKYLIMLEKNRQNSKKHYQENKGYYATKRASRHAAKLQRTPSWLTENHWDNIKMYYELAGLEEELSVDHIIPLQGENVSGLHVPWNLQIMDLNENKSKRNKL